MALFDRFIQTTKNAFDAIRGPSSRIPGGAILYDPIASLRWVYEYTPRELASIQARRDHRRVIELCEAMLTDDRIRHALELRAETLLGSEVEFVKGQGRRSGRALRAAEAHDDFWEMLPESELKLVVMWGILANFGSARKRWWEKTRAGKYVPRVRNGRVVPILEFWHPRWFRQEITLRDWKVIFEVPGSVGTTERHMTWDDGEFCRFSPYGGSGDVSRGGWVASCKLWLLKQMAIVDWATLGGRLGYPTTVVEYSLGQQGVNTVREGDGGGADAKRKQLVDEIFAMGKRGVISLPPGFTAKYLAMPATSHQMFKEQVSFCDTAQSIFWTGNNLTAEVKGGSLAAAQQAGKTLGNKTKFDAAAESSFLRDEVLKDWSEVNFADREAAPWPLRNVEPPEDVTASANMTLALARAIDIFEKGGWTFDKAKTAERYSLDLVEGQKNTPSRKVESVQENGGDNAASG
jgi:hypothetical protein